MSWEARLSITGRIQIFKFKMVSNIKPKDIDTVILCGGRGQRLRSLVSGRPKPMCEFGGRPFLSMLMEYAAVFGFRRFILCAGYRGGMIKKYYETNPLPWETLICLEKKALGTGGAVKNAQRFIRSNPFLVMNADSFAAIPLDKFLDFHLGKKALFSLALVKGSGNKNTGKVTLNQSRRILRFEEKKIVSARCFNSAGIYLMDKSIFSLIKSPGKFSLEYDLFPCLVNKRCFGYARKAGLIDFGTPDEYQKAQRLFVKGVLPGKSRDKRKQIG